MLLATVSMGMAKKEISNTKDIVFCCPGRTICMGPYGSKTTKVDVKDLKPLDWLPASVTSGLLPCPDLCCGWS